MPLDLSRIPESMLDEPPDGLLEWARTTLTEAGYRLLEDEPPQLRLRSWSSVVRMTTDRGPVWAKANPRAFAYEAGLATLLAARAPQRMPAPIAVEPSSGWLITADGGPTLRETLPESAPLPAATAMALLTDYAALQQAMPANTPGLSALGLDDMTPPTLPEWYRRVLDRIDVEPHAQPLLTPGRRQQLTDLIPWTRRWAAELAGSPLPLTLEHNDLHTNNVFARDLLIFDWGDAVVSHPFMGLGRSLTMVDAGDIEPVRDAYLRCWSPAGTAEIPPDVRRAAQLAEPLGHIALAGSWLRLPIGFDPQWAGWFVGHLTDFIDQTAPLRR